MSDILIYKIHPHGRIKISKDVLSTMLSYQQYESDTPESGGLLVGRYIADCDDIVIDKLTVPMKWDIQTRCFFKKNKNSHQKLLKTWWEKSKWTCNYIGEWHTHPEHIPHPSAHDFEQWKKVLAETHTCSSSIFFVIVGIQSTRVWQGFRQSLTFTELLTE